MFVKIQEHLFHRKKRRGDEESEMDRDTHVVLHVDVAHALVVQLLLHVGDGGVVSWDAVDAGVLQPPLLHQLTAHLHDQGHKLRSREEQKRQSELL